MRDDKSINDDISMLKRGYRLRTSLGQPSGAARRDSVPVPIVESTVTSEAKSHFGLLLSILAFACLLCGTAKAGITELVKDINTAEVVASSSPWFLGVAGDRAIFAGTKPRTPGSRLFRTDGTAAGTAEFAATGLVNPRNPLKLGTRLLFVASADKQQIQSQLWITDGTDAGTIPLIGLWEPGIRRFMQASDDTRAWFCAADRDRESGCDLYATDGTPAGTLRLTSDKEVSFFKYLAPTGELYFFASALDGSQSALWVSDGTPAGTRLLRTLADMGLAAIGEIAWVNGRTMFVSAQDARGRYGLYSTDIDTGATILLALQNNGFAENAVEMGGIYYFTQANTLWRSDGSPAGTRPLTGATLPYDAAMPLVRLGNRLVFANTDSAHGRELWISDGTDAGTMMLADATPGGMGHAVIIAVTDSQVFFVAGGDGYRMQIWATDGTPANTRVIPPAGGGDYGVYYDSQASGILGTHVFVSLAETPTKPNNPQYASGLWVADLAGTSVTRLGPGGRQAIVMGDRLFYGATDAAGNEPWVSNGFASGTRRITDLAPSDETANSNPADMVVIGTRAFFVADDNVHGRELWITDGTADGTRMVRDITPGTNGTEFESLLAVDGALYFSAKDDTTTSQFPQLWRSDGTEAGTIKLSQSRVASTCENWAAKWNGRVYYFASNTYFTQANLWSTDGTAAGTRQELALTQQIADGVQCDLTATDNGLVFAAYTTSSEYELWRTDGTAPGTMRIGNIRPASAPPIYTYSLFTPVNGLVYFLADDLSGTGRELWRSDGTAANTTLVTDLTPGPDGAGAFGITKFGAGVVLAYQSTDGAVAGLYRVSGPSAGATLVKAGFVTRLDSTSTGSKAFFLLMDNGTESLWLTDGTSAGSHSVITAPPGGSLSIDAFAAGNGLLFFHGTLDANGSQLWVTDGETGVHRLSNFTPPYDGIGYALPLLNGLPLFAHADMTGNELWKVSNQAPAAQDDMVSLPRDASVLIDNRANDSDLDSEMGIVTETIVMQPAHGMLSAESGSWRYIPAAGYVGNDFFEYQLTDELNAQSSIARVTIKVSAPPRKRGGGGTLETGWLALLSMLLCLRLVRLAWPVNEKPPAVSRRGSSIY